MVLVSQICRLMEEVIATYVISQRAESNRENLDLKTCGLEFCVEEFDLQFRLVKTFLGSYF